MNAFEGFPADLLTFQAEFAEDHRI